jgi:DNA invertase Pin-like site-specific DNA recombinase
LGLLDAIKAAGPDINALDDEWLDSTTPYGELIFAVMGGLHEFEWKLIRARCDEGINRAKARGTVFGRKPVLDAGERRKIADRFAAGETMAELFRDSMTVESPPSTAQFMENNKKNNMLLFIRKK